MTRATSITSYGPTATPATGESPRSTGAGTSWGRGLALIVGAVVIAAVIESGTLPYYWFPALAGLTYLIAATAGRSQDAFWGARFIITSVGLTAALWLHDGRPAASFEFLALVAMALGLGGVIAAAFARLRGVTLSAMTIALPVLLFGTFALLEQQAVKPAAGRVRVYAALLALRGGYEFRVAFPQRGNG